MPNSDSSNSAMPRRRFLRDSALSAASFAAPWSLGVLPSEGLAAPPEGVVWELNLKNGRATNCQLSFARVVPIGAGGFCVEADSRHNDATWHSCIAVPAGLLRAGQDYVITLSYEIIERSAADSYFYVFARSNRMNPLDEKSRAPGVGVEFGGFTPTRIVKIDDQTVRVWPSYRMKPVVGRLYLLRHYTYEKHGIAMADNSHLSLRNVNIYSFPGIGFITGGNQHHFELIGCRIAPPPGERRPITTSADGFHVAQSQGFIRLE
jgi:hypothetical protein